MTFFVSRGLNAKKVPTPGGKNEINLHTTAQNTYSSERPSQQNAGMVGGSCPLNLGYDEEENPYDYDDTPFNKRGVDGSGPQARYVTGRE